MESKIEKLQAFLIVNPADSFVQHALALEFIKVDRLAEARALFEGILQRDPGYVGSYYHLAKLLEQTGENGLAFEWYDKGMAAAKAAGDGHAFQELQGAREELAD